MNTWMIEHIYWLTNWLMFGCVCSSMSVMSYDEACCSMIGSPFNWTIIFHYALHDYMIVGSYTCMNALDCEYMHWFHDSASLIPHARLLLINNEMCCHIIECIPIKWNVTIIVMHLQMQNQLHDISLHGIEFNKLWLYAFSLHESISMHRSCMNWFIVFVEFMIWLHCWLECMDTCMNDWTTECIYINAHMMCTHMGWYIIVYHTLNCFRITFYWYAWHEILYGVCIHAHLTSWYVCIIWHSIIMDCVVWSGRSH